MPNNGEVIIPERNKPVSIKEKIDKAKAGLEKRLSELSDRKKVTLAALAMTTATTACLVTIGLAALYPADLPRPIVETPTSTVVVEEEKNKESEFRRSHFEVSREELAGLIRDADKLTYYSLTRGGFAPIRADVIGDTIVADTMAYRALDPDDVAPWIKGLTFGDVGCPQNIAAIRMADGEEMVFFLPASDMMTGDMSPSTPEPIVKMVDNSFRIDELSDGAVITKNQ